jgi:hypothetical protein
MSIRVVKFSMEFNIERIYKAIKLFSKGDIILPYKYLNYYFKNNFDAMGLSWCQNKLDYELGEDGEFDDECSADRELWENVFLQCSCCCDDLEELVEKILISYTETKLYSKKKNKNHLPKKWKDYLECRGT